MHEKRIHLGIKIIFIHIKNFVVSCVFDPWHLRLVAFWHDIFYGDHQFRAPFPGQGWTSSLLTHCKTSTSTGREKQSLVYITK